VRDVGEPAELGLGVSGVEQVGCHVAHRSRRLAAASRDADDLPVAERSEMFHEVAADHALAADDECDLLRAVHRCSYRDIDILRCVERNSRSHRQSAI
jgi:hypothetical protein